MMLERDSLKTLDETLSILEQGFASMPDFKPTTLPAKGREVLMETARRPVF